MTERKSYVMHARGWNIFTRGKDGNPKVEMKMGFDKISLCI